MTSSEDVLLAQARSQLTRQEGKLDQLRVLAAAALTGGGVVVGFVAPTASRTAGWWTLIPVAAFVVMAWGAGLVLSPRTRYVEFDPVKRKARHDAEAVTGPGLRFSEDLTPYLAWISSYGSAPKAGTQFSLGLAKNLSESAAWNEPVVQRMATETSLTVVLFGLQVLAWAVLLVAK